MKRNIISLIITIIILAMLFTVPVRIPTRDNETHKFKTDKKIAGAFFTIKNYVAIDNTKTVMKKNKAKKNTTQKNDNPKDNIHNINKRDFTTTNDTNNDEVETESSKNTGKSSKKTKQIINYTPDFTIDKMPTYPTAAKRLKQEGRVSLKIFVNKVGEIISVVVVASSGFKLLDDSATKAVYDWDFSKLDLVDKTNIITTEIVYKLNNI